MAAVDGKKRMEENLILAVLLHASAQHSWIKKIENDELYDQATACSPASQHKLGQDHGLYI
jgi:hypothetical protein